MIKDKLVAVYVNALKNAIRAKESDLARTSVTDMYHLGRLQGQINGLEDALSVLDSVLSEDDQD